MSATAALALILQFDGVPAGSSLVDAVWQLNEKLASLRQPVLFDFETLAAKGAVSGPIAGGRYTAVEYVCSLLPRTGLTFRWIPGHPFYIYPERGTDTLANACTIANDWLKDTPADVHPPVWACGCKADRRRESDPKETETAHLERGMQP